MRTTCGGASRRGPHSASAFSSSPTSPTTLLARSRSVSAATPMSRVRYAQRRARFEATMIWPFGTTCSVPSRSRSVVRRRLKSSTTPSTPTSRTTSPALYWFSSTMKMPASQSRTSVCAPKPRAIPTTPRPATAGPMSIPNRSSAMRTPMIAITAPATRTTSVPIVRTRRSSSACGNVPVPASSLRRSRRWRTPMPTPARTTRNPASAASAMRAIWSVISTDTGRFGRSSMAGMVATTGTSTVVRAPAVLPGAAVWGRRDGRRWTGRTTRCRDDSSRRADIGARSNPMTSKQRRPGFRLPWSTEEEAAQAASQADAEATASPVAPASSNGGAEAEASVDAAEATPAAAEDSELEAPATTSAAAGDSAPNGSAPTPEPSPTAGEPAQGSRPAAVAEPAPAQAETSAGFMRDLVEAMRRVAEETRQAGLSDLREKSEEQVRKLEADSERHREELRARAEADIAGVAAWASSEEERIKNEAEQRVVGRRAQLDQQLAAEASRADAEAKALRDRVAAYEGELDAYHAQLSDIADPAAFAAAAKRMPSPPELAGSPAPE